jgi:hypothetical protein
MSRYYLEGIPKCSGRPVLRAYIQYYCMAVQRLFCMIMYYSVDSVNNVSYVWYFWTYVHYTVHRVRCIICQHMLGGPLAYVRAKDKSVRPSTLAYVRTKGSIRPIQKSNSSKCPSSIYSSDPKSKLTF